MIVDLIAATRTKTGLKVRAQIDSNLYPSGLKVSDKQVAALHIERDAFHGEMELQDLAAGICKLNHLFCDSPLVRIQRVNLDRESGSASRYRPLESFDGHKKGEDHGHHSAACYTSTDSCRTATGRSGGFLAGKLRQLLLDPVDELDCSHRGIHFTPDYPTSCGWPVRLPRRCWTISE